MNSMPVTNFKKVVTGAKREEKKIESLKTKTGVYLIGSSSNFKQYIRPCRVPK